jgi:hypothetical protein
MATPRNGCTFRKTALTAKGSPHSEMRLGFNHLREHLRFHNLGRACVRVPLSKENQRGLGEMWV